MRKTKILISNEFSQLSTGFATYMRYVLPELYNTGKYEIAEHATYCDANDPRILEVPWKIYANEPNKNNPKEMQLYNSNKGNQFGWWKFDEVCLDFQPDIVCIHPDTLLFTDKGYIPIHQVQIGHQVLTHNNRMKNVTKVMKRQCDEKLYYIYTNGCKEPMKITGDHPVLVYKYKKQTNQAKSIDKIYNGLKPEFKSANSLDVGDLVVLPKVDSNLSITLDITNYLINYFIDNNKISLPNMPKNSFAVNRFIEINNNFGRLCGYIIGDGCLQNNGIQISFQGNEEIFALDAQKLFKEIFDLESTISTSKDRYMITVQCNSAILEEFFTNFLGYRTRDKFIPYEFFISRKETKEGMINGLVRSDGCYSQNTVNFTTINKSLAYQYRLLCNSIDICTTISFHKNNYGNVYAVNGYGKYAEKLHLIVNKQNNSPHNQDITSSSRRSYHVHQINNHMVASIRRIRTIPYKGLVYNIEVEEDNSYTLQWCVHNCTISDAWMHPDYIIKSPYRKHFKLIYMPTCDGQPQKPEWLQQYGCADKILTYSLWAKYVLEYESGNKLSVSDVASPGTDCDIFLPLKNKQEIRNSLGITTNGLIFQTVMRNQPRKLYNELFKTFARYLEILHENGQSEIADKSFLYCHTSFPDVGWDLSQELRRYHLSHKVLFTYMCPQCGAIYSSFFNSEVCRCRKCRNLSASMPNTMYGVPREVLAKIMGMADMYIQYSIAAGWEMPINDAKACGIPAMAQCHSAMTEQMYNGGGIPINVDRLFQEPINATNQWRALPDIEDAAQKMYAFAISSQEEKDKLSKEARECAEKYDWKNIAKIWEKTIDNLAIDDQNNTWFGPPKFINPNLNIPQGLNNEQFIEWCYKYIMFDPQLLNSYLAQRSIASLNLGYDLIQNEDGQPIKVPSDRNKIIQDMLQWVQQRNNLEQYRYNKLVLREHEDGSRINLVEC